MKFLNLEQYGKLPTDSKRKEVLINSGRITIVKAAGLGLISVFNHSTHGFKLKIMFDKCVKDQKAHLLERYTGMVEKHLGENFFNFGKENMITMVDNALGVDTIIILQKYDEKYHGIKFQVDVDEHDHA